MKKLLTLLALGMFSVFSYAQTDSTTVRDTSLQKTDEVLSTILSKSLVVAEKTGEFVIEQAPDVLREFYIWHTVKHSFWLLIGIVLLIVVIRLPRLWLRKESNDRYNEEKFFNMYGDGGEVFAAYAVTILGSLFTGALVIGKTLDLLYITLSPKLYLIEYVLNLKQ